MLVGWHLAKEINKKKTSLFCCMIQDLTYFRTFWGHYNLPIWNKDSSSSIWQYWLGGFKSGIKKSNRPLAKRVVFKRLLWYLLKCIGEPTNFGSIFTKYNKASRYPASSCTDLAVARFWIGSKKIWDKWIYVAKTLSSEQHSFLIILPLTY